MSDLLKIEDAADLFPSPRYFPPRTEPPIDIIILTPNKKSDYWDDKINCS